MNTEGSTAWVLVNEAADEQMASRLAASLHPIAGRPLLWHALRELAALRPAVERVRVLSPCELDLDAFAELDLPLEVSVAPVAERARSGVVSRGSAALLLDAASFVPRETLRSLLDGPSGRWVGDGRGAVSAALLGSRELPELLRLPHPLRTPNGVLDPEQRLSEPGALAVRDRVDFARATAHIRDVVVATLMRAGVTFLLPETVLVDVDVRIGADSVVYPGAVLEGQTTIGEETVVGPGCRVVDSWIGSGVELKGWNYISHTSVRNRAILEPHVRRGFD